MRTIKVYAVGSHQTKERTSGVDYARVYNPMKHLQGYTDGKVKFLVDFYDIHKEEQDSWMDIADKYDIIFLNYTVLDWSYATMGAFVHGKNKKIIMDLDDAIWHVQKDNIVHDKLKEMNAEHILTCILNDVDGVTTTNRYLRNMIGDKTYKQHKDIQVIENHIDLDYYKSSFPAKERDEITIMHYGSTSHFDDLLEPEFLEGMDKILKQYPNVIFKTVGSFISQLRYKWGPRYVNAFGDVDVYKWIQNKFPEYMEEADIMVVPLRDTVYNRCKSDIKFLETASAKKPGVFSATRPYTDTIIHEQTGMIANNAEEWYEYIKKLIEDTELRRKIGENAFQYVTTERQMKDHVGEYAEFFLKILDKE